MREDCIELSSPKPAGTIVCATAVDTAYQVQKVNVRNLSVLLTIMKIDVKKGIEWCDFFK